MSAGSVLAEILSGIARDIARGQGPEKWCGRCSRYHATRAPCQLIEAHVPAKSGRLVKRQIHGTGD